MHTERLIALAELLEEDANTPTGAQFNLGFWVGRSDCATAYEGMKYDPEALGISDKYQDETTVTVIPIKPDKLPKMSCGTTACALGLALLSGRFAKWGLTGGVELLQNKASIVPMCNGKARFDAGAELFGISQKDSQYLFDPDHYDGTPLGAKGEILVAKRIRDFVDGNIDDDQYHLNRWDD